MGHDEDKNSFDGGMNPVSPTPITPNPRAQFSAGNRIGMRPARTFSAQEELDRISVPTSQSTGDIVINNPQKKSSKKPIIIALIVLMLIGGGLAVFLSLQRTKAGNGIVSNASLDKFNDFASYYLGENVDFNETYVSYNDYAVDKAVKDGNGSFFDTATEKYEAFMSTINDSQSEEIRNYIDRYEMNLRFAYVYSTNPIPTDEEILKKYLAEGVDATKTYLNNVFEPLVNVNFDSKTVASNELAYYLASVDLLDYYRVNGCLSDEGEADDECIMYKNPEEATNLYNSLSELKTARQSLKVYYNESKTSLWKLYEMLTRKDEE